jgi:hypothetical protein
MSAAAGGGFGIYECVHDWSLDAGPLDGRKEVYQAGPGQGLETDFILGKGVRCLWRAFRSTVLVYDRAYQVQEEVGNSFAAGFLTSIALAADDMRGRDCWSRGLAAGLCAILFYKGSQFWAIYYDYH